MNSAFSHKLHFSSAIILCMTIALVVLCSFTTVAYAKNIAKPENKIKKTRLLFFPFDSNQSITNDVTNVTDMLNDVAISRLEITKKYSVMRYSWAFPTIKRMVADNEITAADSKPPFSDDNIKLIKLTKGLDFTIALVGSLDEYNYDADNHTLEITVSARLVDVVSNKVIKLAARTISSPSEMNQKESEIALQTARKACELLMTDLIPESGASKPVKPNIKK